MTIKNAAEHDYKFRAKLAQLLFRLEIPTVRQYNHMVWAIWLRQ